MYLWLSRELFEPFFTTFSSVHFLPRGALSPRHIVTKFNPCVPGLDYDESELWLQTSASHFLRGSLWAYQRFRRLLSHMRE